MYHSDIKNGLDMLSVSKASQYLHVHINTLRRWSARGLIRTYRINQRGDRRYLLADIYQLREELKRTNGDISKVNGDNSGS